MITTVRSILSWAAFPRRNAHQEGIVMVTTMIPVDFYITRLSSYTSLTEYRETLIFSEQKQEKD